MSKTIFKAANLCLVILLLSVSAGCTGRKPIHKAARKGDLEKVKRIIDRDPNQINAQDLLKMTPLYLASMKGHTEVVEFLLEHGADIELGNDLNERPLAKAAKFGHYDTVKVLLEHGATANCRDKFGRAPLHDAAMWSGRDIIDILISYGADVSAKDNDNDTPLHQAVMLENMKAAKALVEHGADLLAKNDFNYRQLYIAATRDNNEAAERLLRRATPGYRDNKNKTPKEIALKAGFKELAQYLEAKEEERSAVK